MAYRPWIKYGKDGWLDPEEVIAFWHNYDRNTNQHSNYIKIKGSSKSIGISEKIFKRLEIYHGIKEEEK